MVYWKLDEINGKVKIRQYKIRVELIFEEKSIFWNMIDKPYHQVTLKGKKIIIKNEKKKKLLQR